MSSLRTLPVPPDPSLAGPLLRDADFRRLWAIGLIGFLVRWLEILVYGIFTYQQTGSAFLVAGMIMLRLLPLAVLGVPLGALAARSSRRTGMLIGLSGLAIGSLVLLALAALDRLAVWHLAAASVLNGIAWAGDNPYRRGLIGDVSGPQRMGTAMALDVGASNATRLIGPAAGGLLLAQAGMTAVFLALAALQVAALALMWQVRDRPLPVEPSLPGLRGMLSEGFEAARASPRLAATLWVTVVFNLFAWPALSMVPVIGQDRLGLAAAGIGLLASMDGLGTLLGAAALAVLSRPALYGRLYIGGVVLFLAMLPLFAFSTHPLAAGTALLVLGIGQSAFSVMQATIVYIAAPVDRRPQAMGLLTMCIGTGPLGFLMLGGLAEHLGATPASALCAATGLAVLGLSWPWWRACWRDAAQPPPSAG